MKLIGRSKRNKGAKEIKTQNLEEKNPWALQDKIIKKINESEKKLCKVIIATPTYFVIEKDGEKITIEEKNNYKRNDGILY